MSEEQGHAQLCVYCIRETANTVDHIPPKLLLSKPYPENLLTVPACRDCNLSFQKDDEYTRFMASVDLKSASQPTVQNNMSAILRSLQRPESQKFASYLVGQSQHSTVLGADGMPMGLYFEPESDRLNATGRHIVRGLYFVETGLPLSASLQLRVACKSGLTAEHPDVLQFARIYRSLSDKRHRSIGDAFSYVVGFYANWSVWLMLLYSQFFWLAIVQKVQ